MKRFLLFILSVFFFCHVVAQYESVGMPLKFSLEKETLKRSTSSFFVNLNADTTKISLDASHRVVTTGVTCPVDISIEDFCLFIENGLRVYRIGLSSENAKGISLFFDRFLLPEGGKLFVYNSQQTIILGAFTSENNNAKNQLLIRPLMSDSVVVEYQEPLDAPFKADIHISLATHEVRAVNTFLSSNVCSPHAALEQKALLLKQSVCLLYMVGTTNSYLGSGALINNPEHKPYVYTAGHNITDEGIATRTIYYFNYEVPAQDSTFQGSLQQTISGSKLISRDDNVDFALVELNKMPPAYYRPYMAGWTRNTPVAPLMCIQHPSGDVKKVSFSQAEPTISYFDNTSIRTYWWIKKWDKGVTESGSSGSPLFDSNGYIVGELTGGSSYCDTPVDDFFCIFSSAWNYYSEKDKQLAYYLDPNGENTMSMEGYDPYSSLGIRRISNINIGDEVSINRVDKTPLVGHNSSGFTEFAEKFELENSVYVYGTYMMPFWGRYNESLPIKINIYSGVNTPENLLSTVEVHPTEAFCTRGGVWSEKDITKFKKQEIYVPLPEPILVDNNLFVSIQIRYQNMTSLDSLAMATAVGKEECTAYLFEGGWKSFQEHSLGEFNASIWVDPVIGDKSVVSIDETEAKELCYTLSPNPTHGDVFINPSFTGDYELYNLGGSLIQKGSFDTKINLPESGFYILELYPKEGKKETHKLICR